MWNSKVIIACDFSSKKQLMDFLANFNNEKLFLKLGMELIYSAGFELIAELKALGHQIFLDLKLHDISETVKKTVGVLAKYEIDFLTIHLMCGANTVQVANEIANKNDIKLLGVTLLTNLDDNDLNEFFNPYCIKTTELINNLSNLANNAQLYGVICSAWEAQLIKEKYPRLKTITPGVNLSNKATDQKRIFTPSQAKELGSDFIVVGRAITKDEKPYQIYQKIINDFS